MTTIDLQQFIQTAITGFPLTGLIMALVQFSKSLGASGKMLTIISMVIGVIFGGCFMYVSQPPTGETIYWFLLVVYGLVIGLTACGIYDTAVAVIGKGLYSFSDKK